MRTENIRICKFKFSVFSCTSSVGIVDSLVKSITSDWVGAVFLWNGDEINAAWGQTVLLSRLANKIDSEISEVKRWSFLECGVSSI